MIDIGTWMLKLLEIKARGKNLVCIVAMHDGVWTTCRVSYCRLHAPWNGNLCPPCGNGDVPLIHSVFMLR